MKNKREVILKLFSSTGVEVKKSKNDNYYIELLLSDDVTNKDYALNAWNVSPKTINQIGKTWRIVNKHSILVMINSKNQIYVRLFNENRFKKLNKNIVRTNSGFSKVYSLFIKLYYLGKKAEWISEPKYNKFFGFKLAESFKSFKEFKNYLGFSFISEEKMLSLFERINFNPFTNAQFICDIILQDLDRVILANTTTKWTYIADILEMFKQLNLPIEIYESDFRNKEVHNHLVKLINQKDLDVLSDEDVRVYEGDFVEELNKLYNVEWLTSPRKLAIAGLRNKHCIGTYFNSLKDCLFFSILYENEYYEFQVRLSDNRIIQQHGYKNGVVPNSIISDVDLLIQTYGIESKLVNIIPVTTSSNIRIVDQEPVW